VYNLLSPILSGVEQVSRGREYFKLPELGASLWAGLDLQWFWPVELVARGARASLPGWKTLHLIPSRAALVWVVHLAHERGDLAEALGASAPGSSAPGSSAPGSLSMLHRCGQAMSCRTLVSCLQNEVIATLAPLPNILRSLGWKLSTHTSSAS